MKKRRVVFFNKYFESFYRALDRKSQKKALWTLRLLEELDQIPEQYLKHITGTSGLYELRFQQGRKIYRMFCWFDEGHLVVIGSGFQKKSRRTAKTELQRALRIKENTMKKKII